MSGPKDYSPPPSYSIKVFDGKLNNIFRLQTILQKLCSDIESMQISDPSFNIVIDCKAELRKIIPQIKTVQKNLVFHYTGKFGQDTHNKIDREIDIKLSSLGKLIRECELIQTEFEGKNNDYECFIAYNTFYKNTQSAFDNLKVQIIKYLKNNVETSSSAIRDEGIDEISKISIKKDKPNFYFGFKANFAVEKQVLMELVLSKESDIDRIRTEMFKKLTINNKSIITYRKLTPPTEKILNHEIKDIIKKIENILESCENKIIVDKYRLKFDQLVTSKSCQDIYFYKELHDYFLKSEKERKSKIEIGVLLSELNNIKVHPTQDKEKQILINICLENLSSSSFRPDITEDVKRKIEQLKNLSDKRFVEDAIKLKEHIFLKSQIIQCLQNQGYEVMTDLEVIDFEKENDFLIKINKQTNYLNLKFRNDNSIHYVFQIPESKDELSTDKKNLKLYEMKVTCSEFKTVLSDLAAMGLNINLQSEKPIDLNTIVSITKNQKEKMKSVEKLKQVKQELKKNYLTH